MGRLISIPMVLLILAPICCLLLCGCGSGDAAEPMVRADIVVLDGGKPPIELERPPVEFPHDRHYEVMKELGKDCSVCHPLDDEGHHSLLYMRLPDSTSVEGSRAAVDIEALYHDNCIGCHNTEADAGKPSGPVACGECHRDKPEYTSSWRPIGFDKSLHYRHIKAQDSKCETCHHEYDEITKTLIYVKGKEAPCRDCHHEQTVDNSPSFALVAHSACIECHRKTTLDDPTAASGPQTCGGCHDPQHQAAIKVIENPPRLKRDQPDFVLLSAPPADLESSKLNTVPFSHIGHEKATTTCRGCHHETLARCTDCHTLAGEEKGSEVTLRQAMHNMTSQHSCVGCHNTHKTDIGCAGCHDLMEQGRLSEHACNICHAGPQPPDLEKVRSLYASMDQFQPKPADVKLTFSADEIPDTVTIGVLAKEYPAVKMPHGLITRKLSAYIAASRIATHFHGSEDVVCEGCHHHGSIGRKPALCENCHRRPFNENDLFRPGLYGAYHQRCLGCHVSMDIQDPSDCKVCHKKDDKTTLGMTSRRAVPLEAPERNSRK